MRYSPRTLRIVGASVIALVFIGGAYLQAGPGGILGALNIVNAKTSEELLKAYAAKDTDNDGLPDWQEALYGTDPNNPMSFKAGVTDGDAVAQGLIKPKVQSVTATTTAAAYQPLVPGAAPTPGSLTDQFSQEFFESFINAGGGQAMSDDAKQALITSLIGDFSTKAKVALDSPYTSVSVHTQAGETVLQYSAAVEAVLRAHDVAQGQGDPVTLMDALLEQNDETARPKIQKLAAAYAAIATALAVTPVPPALADEHLSLLQSFDTLARATTLVANYEKDPVAVLGSLAVYQPASQAITVAFQGIATALLAEGEPAPGTPGRLILNYARNVPTP